MLMSLFFFIDFLILDFILRRVCLILWVITRAMRCISSIREAEHSSDSILCVILGLVHLGGAHQLSPLSDGIVTRQNVYVGRTAAHEGQETVVKELALMLLVKQLGLLAGYRRSARSDDFEIIVDY